MKRKLKWAYYFGKLITKSSIGYYLKLVESEEKRGIAVHLSEEKPRAEKAASQRVG